MISSEYCLIVNNNNIDCYTTESEALKNALEHKGEKVKIFLVEYDTNGQEIGFTTIYED